MIRSDVPVSIGMPIFNDKDFLAKSLNSILQQTYRDFELIISDDCSNDGSAEICKDYVQKDPRIIYIRQTSNIGISKNMEFLLNNSRGKYFMWAADDDLWHPEFIERLMNAFLLSSRAIVAFCPYLFIDDKDNIIRDLAIRKINYNSTSAFKRMLALTRKWDDGFGYGLFKREKIKNVKFPVWWWINKRCAYNNIYPTLYYYLAKGQFVYIEGDPLWYNRLKPEQKINHNTPYSQTFIRCCLAFILRRFNLYCKCIQSILSANILNFYLVILLSPFFLNKFIRDIYSSLKDGLMLYQQGYKTFW